MKVAWYCWLGFGFPVGVKTSNHRRVGMLYLVLVEFQGFAVNSWNHTRSVTNHRWNCTPASGTMLNSFRSHSLSGWCTCAGR